MSVLLNQNESIGLTYKLKYISTIKIEIENEKIIKYFQNMTSRRRTVVIGISGFKNEM